jgi:hypothetical protein
MEQLDYNLPYRWFVGLGVDERGSVFPGAKLGSASQ